MRRYDKQTEQFFSQMLGAFYEFVKERQQQMKDVFEKAKEKRAKYRENLTPEKLAKLQSRPPIGECSHLKGVGPYIDRQDELSRKRMVYYAPFRDYNISVHTFIDGRTRVRCLRCGETRWKGELGYDEFLKMTESSTNIPTATEIPMKGKHAID